MTTTVFSLLVALGSIAAGLLGALTGLGGGVVIVPMLTLAFGVDFRYAAGAALVSVIATSSGAAAAYVREGYTNLRVGMLLEVATVAGAMVGAWGAGHVPTSMLAVVFGLVLLHAAYSSSRHRDEHVAAAPDRWAQRLRLDSTCPTPRGPVRYHVRRVPLGFAVMVAAGILSGLLGIGSGALKVLAMDRAMQLPFKVSTTTSNFMIGVTAAASAGVYSSRGWIEPAVAMPVVLGVLAGASLGARILVRARSRSLRLAFSFAVGALAIEMMHAGVTGRL